jgi:hypothetical protein
MKELPSLTFTEHHQAHAASVFFPNPFERAGVLCMDRVGEWAAALALDEEVVRAVFCNRPLDAELELFLQYHSKHLFITDMYPIFS